jgi:putative transposase
MEQSPVAVFPVTALQTCIVLLIHSSLDHAGWKKRRAVAEALKPIHTAQTVEVVLVALAEFEQGPWSRE